MNVATRMSAPAKKLYFFEEGWASWHQRRAGHFFAASITLDLTDEEFEARCAKLKEKHVRFLAYPLDRLPPTHYARQPPTRETPPIPLDLLTHPLPKHANSY